MYIQHIFAIWSQIKQIQLFFTHFNPLSPHDALKHHFTSLKTYLILLKLRGFRRKISMNLVAIHGSFLIFFTHSKSSSPTTSREL